MTEKRAVLWLAAFNDTLLRFDITTIKRQAAFLAQLLHESGGFKPPPAAESFNYAATSLRSTFGNRLSAEDCARLGRKPGETRLSLDRQRAIANAVYQNRFGNGDVASGDGWRYRGSGLIQLTFKDNFRTAGSALALDLVGDPERVRKDPSTAALVSGWYWSTRDCNALADAGQFDAITQKINPARFGADARNEAFIAALAALSA